MQLCIVQPLGYQSPEVDSNHVTSFQKVARIVSLPEPRVAVLQFCPHSASMN